MLLTPGQGWSECLSRSKERSRGYGTLVRCGGWLHVVTNVSVLTSDIPALAATHSARRILVKSGGDFNFWVCDTHQFVILTWMSNPEDYLKISNPEYLIQKWLFSLDFLFHPALQWLTLKPHSFYFKKPFETGLLLWSHTSAHVAFRSLLPPPMLLLCNNQLPYFFLHHRVSLWVCGCPRTQATL